MTKRILFVGESWASYGVHTKGLSSYTTSSYEEGATVLLGMLRAAGFEVTYVPNHLAVEDLPYDTDEFQSRFDAVILSDVPSDVFLLPKAVFVNGERRPNRLRSIRDFVANGGGLLMIGGYMSFAGFEGRARFGITPLAAALPVSMLTSDDRVEAPEGIVPEVVGEHAVLDGISGTWPYFLGYNRVSALPDSQTVLSIDDDPLLVVGTFGEGRTAAFTSDCSPHWGSPDFMEWPHYERFWTQLAAWLVSK